MLPVSHNEKRKKLGCASNRRLIRPVELQPTSQSSSSLNQEKSRVREKEPRIVRRENRLTSISTRVSQPGLDQVNPLSVMHVLQQQCYRLPNGPLFWPLPLASPPQYSMPNTGDEGALKNPGHAMLLFWPPPTPTPWLPMSLKEKTKILRVTYYPRITI